jgi:hypothetical protein
VCVCVLGGASMGAPNTHKMSGLSLVKHVHWSSHCRTVLRSRVLVSCVDDCVRSCVCLFDCSVCAIWCIAFIMVCYT